MCVGLATPVRPQALIAAERQAFARLRRSVDRLVEPLRLTFAVRLARRTVRRNQATWRRTYRDLCAGNA